ncbi:unnamed protein product [Arctogadus glacialis]
MGLLCSAFLVSSLIHHPVGCRSGSPDTSADREGGPRENGSPSTPNPPAQVLQVCTRLEECFVLFGEEGKQGLCCQSDHVVGHVVGPVPGCGEMPPFYHRRVGKWL